MTREENDKAINNVNAQDLASPLIDAAVYKGDDYPPFDEDDEEGNHFFFNIYIYNKD